MAETPIEPTKATESTSARTSSHTEAATEGIRVLRHQTALVFRLLLRLNSSATDESIQNAGELLLNLQSMAEDPSASKKKAELGLDIVQEQAYHIEYALPVDDSKGQENGAVDMSKFIVDVIGFQYMAKVYYGKVDATSTLDDVETTCVRYFRNNEHTFAFIELETTLSLSEHMVRRLATHNLEVQVFESVDKLCPKAKADLKNIRRIAWPEFQEVTLPVKQEKEVNARKGLNIEEIEQQRVLSAAAKLADDFRNNLPEWRVPEIPPIFPTASSLIRILPRADTPLTPTPELAKLPKTEMQKKMTERKSRKDGEAARKAKRKAEAQKNPVMVFRGLTSKFFTDSRTIFIRGILNPKAGFESDPATELVCTLFDGILGLGIKDGNFLSEEMKRKLNPLTISIKAVENLPDKPLGFETLHQSCHPAYFTFDRFGLETYRSSPEIHAPNMCWDEPVVTFLDMLDPELFREFAAGPPMEISLHDRDRKDGLCDNPYAIGRLDLYPLVAFNMTHLQTELPLVQNSSDPYHSLGIAAEHPHLLKSNTIAAISNVNGAGTAVGNTDPRKMSEKRTSKPASAKDKKKKLPLPPPVVKPFPPGQYQDSGTTMRITITTAYPLKHYIQCSERTGSAPYCRYVIVLPVCNSSDRFVRAIHIFVRCFNSLPLQERCKDASQATVWRELFSFDPHSPHPTTENGGEAKSQPNELDILTGVHFVDPSVHVVIVEGLYENAVANFAEFIVSQMPILNDVEPIKILWDSSLRFSKRLYGDLGNGLFGIRLHKDLSELAAVPHVKMIKEYSSRVFHAVHQLNKIAFNVKVPREMVKRSLFPSTIALQELHHVFGALYIYE